MGLKASKWAFDTRLFWYMYCLQRSRMNFHVLKNYILNHEISKPNELIRRSWLCLQFITLTLVSRRNLSTCLSTEDPAQTQVRATTMNTKLYDSWFKFEVLPKNIIVMKTFYTQIKIQVYDQLVSFVLVAFLYFEANFSLQCYILNTFGLIKHCNDGRQWV